MRGWWICSMSNFIPRTTAPATSNRYYYQDNVFYQSGYGLPNCTAYAWGRFWELSGERPTLCINNAEDWYKYNDGYARGQTPKLGAVIVWAKGQVGVNDDGAGHVAIVEQINADGSIRTSNSAYNGSLFYMQDIPASYALSGYTFQGFIYNPVDFEASGTGEMPTPISGNRWLTRAEMENNAAYIYYYLSARGWTMNAIAGMLGNMETESTVNPGIWQNLDEGNIHDGLGLVQWTPASLLLDYADERGVEPLAMDTQLQYLVYECMNELQYIPTSAYPKPASFNDFKNSNDSPDFLAMAFVHNYERPATTNQPQRGEQALVWYDFLKDLPPLGPGKSKKAMALWLLLAATKKRRVI